MILFVALKENDSDLYREKFNYGFYTATFAIILIAFTQINSINSASLKTRYVNACTRQEEPSFKNLSNQLKAKNIITIIFDLGTIVFYILIIIRL